MQIFVSLDINAGMQDIAPTTAIIHTLLHAKNILETLNVDVARMH